MGKVLHIKDAYFKIPEKCKYDFGCAITMLGIFFQRNNLTMNEMNRMYDDAEVSDFLNDDSKNAYCLVVLKIGETTA